MGFITNIYSKYKVNTMNFTFSICVAGPITAHTSTGAWQPSYLSLSTNCSYSWHSVSTLLNPISLAPHWWYLQVYGTICYCIAARKRLVLLRTLFSLLDEDFYLDVIPALWICQIFLKTKMHVLFHGKIIENMGQYNVKRKRLRKMPLYPDPSQNIIDSCCSCSSLPPHLAEIHSYYCDIQETVKHIMVWNVWPPWGR